MKIVLTPMEARVIGCLIEKQITTPDQYPLSLNALVNACNQKSNRDPLMDVDEPTVQRTLDDLSKKHLILERSGFGSRVPKYQHRFCNTEFGTLKFTPQELAIVCELLLRGPQTPGELRPRAARMAPFTDTDQVEATLETLRTRDDGPFVVRLPRKAGRRDSEYAHLFGGPVGGGESVGVGSEAVAGESRSGESRAAGVAARSVSTGVGSGVALAAQGSAAAAPAMTLGGVAPYGTSGVTAVSPAGASGTAGPSVASSATALGAAPGSAAGTSAPSSIGAASTSAGSSPREHDNDASAEARIARLESEVRQLRSELDSLKSQLGI